MQGNFKYVLIFVVVLSSSVLPAAIQALDTDALKKDAVEIIKQFGSTLQGKLGAAMKSGGPTEAIKVCSKDAPEIASQLSRESGQFVRRVSLKLRNPSDAPDAWEQKALQDFDAAVKSGKDAKDLAFAEVVTEPEGQYFRFLKAIPTAELCLSCHGAKVDPAVEKALKETYPHDVARGYELGMVRGAFSIKRKL